MKTNIVFAKNLKNYKYMKILMINECMINKKKCNNEGWVKVWKYKKKIIKIRNRIIK